MLASIRCSILKGLFPACALVFLGKTPPALAKDLSLPPWERKLPPKLQKVLQEFDKEDKEFDEFEEIEKALSDYRLDELQERLKKFKQNYSLSAYQNLFPLLEAFYRYKGEVDDTKNKEEAEESFLSLLEQSKLTMPPEVASYIFYLQLLSRLEHASPGLLQRLSRVPAFETRFKETEQSFLELREFLREYGDSVYAKDVEERLRAVHHRLTEHELFLAYLLYQQGAYVGAVRYCYQLIEAYPESRSAIQALFIITLCYEKLHFPELAKITWKAYLFNRKGLVNLQPKDSVKAWFRLAKDYPKSVLPKGSDKAAYLLDTPFMRLEKISLQRAKKSRNARKHSGIKLDSNFTTQASPRSRTAVEQEENLKKEGKLIEKLKTALLLWERSNSELNHLSEKVEEASEGSRTPAKIWNQAVKLDRDLLLQWLQLTERMRQVKELYFSEEQSKAIDEKTLTALDESIERQKTLLEAIKSLQVTPAAPEGEPSEPKANPSGAKTAPTLTPPQPSL